MHKYKFSFLTPIILLVSLCFLSKFLKCKSIIKGTSSFEMKDNSYISDDENFSSLRSSSKYFIVEFYFKECPHCISFAPIYSKISKYYNSNPTFQNEIKLAKHDAISYKKTPANYDITQFPTIILFEEGKEEFIEYTGELNFDDFNRWISKKTFEAAKRISTFQELNSLVKASHAKKRTVIILFADNSNSSQASIEITFAQLGKKEDYFDFAICTFDCFKENPDNSLSGDLHALLSNGKIIKSSDNLDMTIDFLSKWVDTNGYPDVLDFNDSTSDLIFGKNKAALFLYRQGNDPKVNYFDDLLQKVSANLQRDINVSLFIFLYSILCFLNLIINFVKII